jgi:hypothetical protein
LNPWLNPFPVLNQSLPLVYFSFIQNVGHLNFFILFFNKFIK